MPPQFLLQIPLCYREGNNGAMCAYAHGMWPPNQNAFPTPLSCTCTCTCINSFSLYRDHVHNFFKSKSSEPVKYERVSCDSHVIVA